MAHCVLGSRAHVHYSCGEFMNTKPFSHITVGRPALMFQFVLATHSLSRCRVEENQSNKNWRQMKQEPKQKIKNKLCMNFIGQNQTSCHYAKTNKPREQHGGHKSSSTAPLSKVGQLQCELTCFSEHLQRTSWKPHHLPNCSRHPS